MKLSGETKFFLGIIVATIAIIGGASFWFSRPTPTLSTTDLITPTTHTKGDAKAAVTLVEFSDFQCPACAAAKPTVDAILNQYKDKIYFAYRHYPLDQHPLGEPAARAAEAAAKQGKFWEMYDLLFTNQASFSEDKFRELAAGLKLDMDKFKADYQSPEVKNLVFADRAAGDKLGVNATPTFFLNGQKLVLYDFADIKAAIEKALK